MTVKSKIIVQDLALAYKDEGKGPTVVMLHGWGADLSSFEVLAGMLTPSYRVIRLDLPGFGDSEQPLSDWHIADYANCVAAFLQKLGVSKVHALLGHSFGGRISIKAVGTGLITPEHVVLVGSAGVRQSQTLRNRVYKAVAKTGKAVTSLPGLSALQPRLRKALYTSAGSTDYLQAGTMKQIFLHTINEDLQADAANITVPTILIWGKNDTETTLAQGEKLASCIPNARLFSIEGAGHYAFIDEPQKVADYILKELA